MRNVALFIIVVLITACSPSISNTTESGVSQGPFFGNGIHNGWADHNSISIWTRLTEKPEMNAKGTPFLTLTKQEANQYAELTDVDLLHSKQIPKGLELKDMEGACLGAKGEVQLVYKIKDESDSRKVLEWQKVDSTKNYTTQWKLKDLIPDTKYSIEVHSRKGPGDAIGDKLIGSFITPPSKEVQKSVAFGIVSCHDYIRKDTTDGHKIYGAMNNDDLDFFAHTGDIEYYDKPNPWAMTEPMMFFKWDRLFALPLQRTFYSNTTSYFMKDDHDVLRDDAYPGMTYGPVTWERGLEIFDKEQFPSADIPYKTVRWGKDLQIWILEGRNFRSKNSDPDGQGKTILGKEQKEWMYRTLTASDATFKVIISANPIVGPDRPKGKTDNYSNKAFETEGTEIREFLNKYENVYVVNGDRHWQYVSNHEGTNLYEFGCGAGSDSHAGGWKQENVQPEHKFLRVKGGYLYSKVYNEGNKAKIRFEHRDVDGNVVHVEEFEG